jgi:hypothetical protein
MLWQETSYGRNLSWRVSWTAVTAHPEHAESQEKLPYAKQCTVFSFWPEKASERARIPALFPGRVLGRGDAVVMY